MRTIKPFIFIAASLAVHAIILFIFHAGSANADEQQIPTFTYAHIQIQLPELQNNSPLIAPPPAKTQETVKQQVSESKVDTETEKTEETTVNEIVQEQESQTEEIAKEARGSSTTESKSQTTQNELSFTPFYKVDTLPTFISKAPLVYPEAAKSNNIEGIVTIEVDLNKDGTIYDSRIIKGPGFGLNESAIKMITSSIFSPAFIGETATAVRMRFQIKFKLE